MSGRFQDFCEETGRDWKQYANIYLFEEFADWVKGEAYLPTNRAEALSDWEKTRRGEISFKIFADKWLPYLLLEDSSIIPEKVLDKK